MRSVSLRNICLKRKLKYICRKKGFYVKDHDQIHLSKKWFLSVSRHIWSFTDRRMFKLGILWIVQLIFKIRIILYLYMYKMVIETIDTIRLILLQSRIWIVRLKIVTQRFDFVRIFPINTYLTRIVCLLIVLIEANPDHFFFLFNCIRFTVLANAYPYQVLVKKPPNFRLFMFEGCNCFIHFTLI